MFRRIFTVARWTTVEMLRERVLYIVLLFAGILVLSSTVLTPLAPGAQKKIVVDFGLAAIDILGVLVILLSGSTLIRREIERRSLDLLLSKPLGRLEYLTGKCLGLTVTLVVTMSLMTILFALSLKLGGFEWKSTYLLAVMASGFEILVVASIAVLFSTFTSPMLASLFTLALFVAGHLTQGVLAQSSDAIANDVLMKVSMLIPALSLFNIRGDVVHGIPIGMDRILVMATYAILYTATMLFVASQIFRRRDFK